MENEPIKEPIVPEAIPENSAPVAENEPIVISKKRLPLWVGVLILLIVVSVLTGYFVANKYRAAAPVMVDTVATPTPTSSVNPGASQISTTSAFLQLEASVASLSAHISGFNPIDSQVVPPVLDLPLGFSN